MGIFLVRRMLHHNERHRGALVLSFSFLSLPLYPDITSCRDFQNAAFLLLI